MRNISKKWYRSIHTKMEMGTWWFKWKNHKCSKYYIQYLEEKQVCVCVHMCIVWIQITTVNSSIQKHKFKTFL